MYDANEEVADPEESALRLWVQSNPREEISKIGNVCAALEKVTRTRR
jgi:hypothetical protein